MSLVSISNLTSGIQNSPGSSQVTGSISPAKNALIVISVSSSRSGVPNTPTITGCGMTWVVIKSQQNSVPNRQTTWFRGLSQNPTSGTLTIDFAGQNQDTVSWNVDQATNVDTSGTNGSGAIVQSNTTNFTNPSPGTYSVTLGAFSGQNNATYGVLADNHGDTWTPGSNFSTVNFNGGAGLNSEFAGGNQTTISFVTSATFMQYLELFAIEIKAKQTFQGAMI